MAKTDKELAVELAIATIAANPRIPYYSKTGVGQYTPQSVTRTYAVDEVQKMTKFYYDMLKDLDNFVPAPRGKSKV